MKSFDRGDSIHAAVLDFLKAFDRVSHHLLVTKLITTGFCQTVVKWISSFLFNRYQRVVTVGHEFSLLSVSSDVPQGPVLSPSSF